MLNKLTRLVCYFTLSLFSAFICADSQIKLSVGLNYLPTNEVLISVKNASEVEANVYDRLTLGSGLAEVLGVKVLVVDVDNQCYVPFKANINRMLEAEIEYKKLQKNEIYKESVTVRELERAFGLLNGRYKLKAIYQGSLTQDEATLLKRYESDWLFIDVNDSIYNSKNKKRVKGNLDEYEVEGYKICI